MTTLLAMLFAVAFPLVGLVIALRAIRKPDRDDFFDNPDDWGAM